MSLKRFVLCFLFKNFQKNKGKTYIQTWFYMPRGFKIIDCGLQYLCYLFGGHELSKTEWGYSGGEFADGWCRWCDKMLRIKKETSYFLGSLNYKDKKDLISLIGGK